jgi:hypothetical protein
LSVSGQHVAHLPKWERDGSDRVQGPYAATMALSWVAATVIGLAVSVTTKIDPVVVAVSVRHGVHLGDLLAFAGSYAAALAITVFLLRERWHRTGTRRAWAMRPSGGGRAGRTEGTRPSVGTDARFVP